MEAASVEQEGVAFGFLQAVKNKTVWRVKKIIFFIIVSFND